MTELRFLDSRNCCDGLRVILQSDGPGVLEVPALDAPRVAIHVGRPVKMDCKHGAESHSGLAVHGDIDIIPSGVPARWEMKETDSAVILRVSSRLLRAVAQESGHHCDIAIRSRFRLRDRQIEHIGWALLAEAQQGYPSGRLYMECMATALAARLVRYHSSASTVRSPALRGLSPSGVLQARSYIEENLGEDLSLQTIADVAGMSRSALKVAFRRATGMPLHQYVIRQRVNRATLLLQEGKLPISQIALEVGFAHQSHMAQHVKRLLGVLPRELLASRTLRVVSTQGATHPNKPNTQMLNVSRSHTLV
jgi:AraC family transcriptional regulator